MSDSKAGLASSNQCTHLSQYIRLMDGTKLGALELIPPSACLYCRIERLTAALRGLMPEGWDLNEDMDHMPGIRTARLLLSGEPLPVETTAFHCKANRTADPPQDCDWPHCGCDPKADKVLEALSEEGILDDAARYKWLRERFLELIVHTSCSPTGRRVDGLEINQRLGQNFDPQSLDQTIDSMLSAERESPQNGNGDER